MAILRQMEGRIMTAVEAELQVITEEIAEEIEVDPQSLAMGPHETAAQAVPVLMERMDKVCGLMDWQATLIENSKTDLEDKKYIHKKAEKDYKHEHNKAYLGFKQADRERFGADFKRNSKTDPEYKAMADMEVDEKLNFALQKERDYLKSQHALEDSKHKYETLNNHFLSYRKSCDLLKIEFEKLGKYGSGI
jgi:hypothetical protein